MAVVNLVATLQQKLSIAAAPASAVTMGLPVILDASVEFPAAASATSTFQFFRIPSKARIRRGSVVQWDDLATTGAPTIDIGLFAVNGNVTSDPDALNDGSNVATAAGSVGFVKDHANWGKKAWEYVNGVTADPGGFLDVYVSLLDADTDTGGTVSATIVYTID